jgi:hypothetical protein
MLGLTKGPIRSHEPLDHRRNQLCWIRNTLSRVFAKEPCVSDEIAMHGRGKFNRELDRLVISQRAELELRHGVPPWP